MEQRCKHVNDASFRAMKLWIFIRVFFFSFYATNSCFDVIFLYSEYFFPFFEIFREIRKNSRKVWRYLTKTIEMYLQIRYCLKKILHAYYPQISL